MIAFETARYGELRYRLRHGLELDVGQAPPGLGPEQA
jgi:hypothetical protein